MAKKKVQKKGEPADRRENAITMNNGEPQGGIDGAEDSIGMEKDADPEPKPRRNWLKLVGLVLAAAFVLFIVWWINWSSFAPNEPSTKEGIEEQKMNSDKIGNPFHHDEEIDAMKADPRLVEERNKTDYMPSSSMNEENSNQAISPQQAKEEQLKEQKFEICLDEAKKAFRSGNYDNARAYLNQIKTLGSSYYNRREVMEIQQRLTKMGQERKNKDHAAPAPNGNSQNNNPPSHRGGSRGLDDDDPGVRDDIPVNRPNSNSRGLDDDDPGVRDDIPVKN